jgi:hypothetical protein
MDRDRGLRKRLLRWREAAVTLRVGSLVGSTLVRTTAGRPSASRRGLVHFTALFRILCFAGPQNELRRTARPKQRRTARTSTMQVCWFITPEGAPARPDSAVLLWHRY